MEFEDMQIIWNSQSDERLFAINEKALHAQIKRKGHSINRKLEMIALIMIAVNLIVGIVLIVDAQRDGGPKYQYIVSALYIAYSIYAVIRRLTRRKEEVRFDQTMLGELDKAIWQTDYLIRQGHSMTLWYVLPLVLVVSVNMFVSSKPLWGLAFLLVLLPASYFGARWETNKWYLPKKRDLESLRETLMASESE